jgi:peptidyl-prolyl cis-trans isomerase SurA
MPGPLATWIIRLLVLAGALAAGAAVAAKAPSTELDTIVAVVEDDVVMRSELDREVRKVAGQLRAQGQKLPPQPALERQVLERLISTRLQLAAAKQSGVAADDQTVDAALASVAKRNNVTVEQMRAILSREGMSFSAYREEIRRQITLGRLRQKEVIEKIRVSDAEIAAFLARRGTQPGESGPRGEYRLFHILIAVPEGASPEQLAAARAKADRLVASLRAGGDFRQTARTASDARQALEGGDLGWLKAGQVPSVFADVVPRLRRGEISDPIRDSNGYHIILLEDFRSGGGAASGKRSATQTRARHILIRTGENVSDDDAKARLTALRERISAGEDFATLARASSDDKATAVNGGELGWVGTGSVVPQFEERMNSLAPGQLSEPFQTQFGWHVVQVLDRRQVDDNQEGSRAEAIEAIRERKAEEATQLFLRRLRDESYVEIRLPAPDQ